MSKRKSKVQPPPWAKEHVCPRCGAVYGVWSSHCPIRDTDEIHCDVCSEVIIRWSGGYTYMARRTKPKRLPKKAAATIRLDPRAAANS